MNCVDIRKKLQPFLEDLLAEEEYKAFCDHIDTCGKCSEYVRSIGALSNQLWKLGKVRVPEDLSSTIMYKLAHPEQEARSSKYILSKKQIIAGFILASLIIALFVGINYLRTRQQPRRDDTPIVRTEVIHKIEESEASSLIKQLETIAAKLGVSQKDMTTEEGSGKKNLVTEESSVAKAPPRKDEVTASKARPLHWHFLCSVKIEDVKLKKEIQKAKLSLQQELKRKELLSNEIEHLREEQRQIELGRHYSETAQKGASEQKLQKESELQKMLDEIKKQEDSIKRIEEEKQRLEVNLRRGIDEKYRKETELNSKLLDAIRAADIRLDYQKNDMLTFNTTGEKIEQLLEQILLLSQGTSSFYDFTTTISILRDKKYNVSIYIGREESNALHWHIDPIMPNKKSDILDIIRESSSSVDHDSDELVILSISSADIGKLRARIQAERVPFGEYGFIESKENTLSSGPITISIYFTK